MPRRTSTFWLSVAAAVAGTALPLSSLRAQPAPTIVPATAPTTAPFTNNDLTAIAGVLSDNTATQNDRDEAARRLSNLATPEAIDALNAVLQNPANVRGQRAIARALTEKVDPDPRFIIPLFALIGKDETLTEPAAQALTNYRGNPDVRARLTAAAVDPQLPEKSRLAVIEAMASLTDKRAAKALLDLFNNPAESIAIRNTAVDTLQQMTGVTGNGRDAGRWQQWWQANADKPDQQFASDLDSARAAQLDRYRIRAERFVDSTRAFLQDTYRATPENRREEMLLRLLRDSSAPMRETGAQIVQNEFKELRAISPAVKEQLRKLIGDSSSRVRLEVARAVYSLNEPAATDPLLAQFIRERDPDVRAVIAGALARMGDTRASEPLLAMLQSNEPDLVRTSAETLRVLAPKIRNADPALAKKISQGLSVRFEQFGGTATALRDSILEAMVPYGDPDLRDTFTRLLRASEPPRTRILALRGFGAMQTDWAAENIIASDALTDPDPSIRLAAVEALSTTATPVLADRIYDRLSDTSMPVQQAAWNVLMKLFTNPQFDASALAIWADRFRDQPDRRLVVLDQWKTKVANNPAELAVVQQNIGDAYLKLGRYADAAIEFQSALDYYSATGGNLAFTEGLVSQLLDAYLLASDYEKATTFAAKWMSQNPGMKPELGRKVVAEAAKLRADGKADDSLKLVELAEQMRDALPPVNQNEIKELREQLRSDLAKQNGGARTIEPAAAQRDSLNGPFLAPPALEPFAMAR